MVSSACLCCVWRTPLHALVIILLCVCQPSALVGTDSQLGDQGIHESDRNPPTANAVAPPLPAEDNAVNAQDNANIDPIDPNAHKDEAIRQGPSPVGVLPKDAQATDNAQSTNQEPAVEALHGNQQPISDQQPTSQVEESAHEPVASRDSPAQHTPPSDTTQPRTDTEEEDGGGTMAEEQAESEGAASGDQDVKRIMDEPTTERYTQIPNTINVQVHQVIKTKNPREPPNALSEEELDMPDKLEEDLEQDGKDAAEEPVVPVLELEMVEEVEETDADTQQISQAGGAINLDKVAATPTDERMDVDEEALVPAGEDEEPKEEIPASVEPAEQEDLAVAKDVSSEKDPSTKAVDGASDGEQKASKDSETTDDGIRETVMEPEDASEEGPKETEKQDVVPVQEDGTKKTEEEEKDEAKGEPEEEPKPDASQKDEEEMPSFDEWKQKMLEQHEQERQHGQAGQGVVVPPQRPFSLTENSKNHASSDCGAKMLNVNKESQNAPAILQSNRDVYTLNPCTANIWFTVELCEPIQVKHLEIANYELFSSLPKSFRVSISDRFPTREWRQIGTFHAREERSLQSFPVLEEQMFAKYMKVEMLTFFGNEHYCPLSILRVFGTSMVEEIDEENIDEGGINQESEVLPANPTQTPEDSDDRSLLQSAKGLVRKVMNVITGNGNGKAAAPCKNKNESCNGTEEMLPCMPEDEPKGLRLHRSNRSASTEKDATHLCQSQYLPKFSLDPVQFHRECHGSTWCFMPNYGQSFQDCCIRAITGSSKTAQPFLCCKDSINLSLYHSALTLQLSPVKKESLHSRKDAKGRKTKPGQVKIKTSQKIITERSEQKDGSTKPKTPVSKTVEDEDLTISAGDSKTSVSSTSEPPLQRQSESQVKPTPSVPPRDVATGERGLQLPQPTPSLKATCSTVPVEQPPLMNIPVDIHPTAADREEAELEMPTGGKQLPPIEVPAVDEDTPVQEIELSKSVKPPLAEETSASSQKDDTAKAKEQNTKAASGPEEQMTVDRKDQVPQTGPTSKDSSSSVEAQLPEPSGTPDQSRKADATGKDPDKTLPTEEAGKGPKTDPPKAESSGKVPESPKTETAGKGTKAVPDPGSNGAGGMGSVAQKESVFMRLNNRIKSLELNMSLSSRYLEELSQRYRKQMDEMQKAFNKTIKTLTVNAQKAEEKDHKQQEYITRLEGQMSEVMMNLETTNQRLDGLHKEVIERHLFIMFIEILLMVVLFLMCKRRYRSVRCASPEEQVVVTKSHTNGIRRNSLPSTPTSKRQNNNRPSRVSGRTISGGSCDDLLIIGPSTPFLESLKQCNESTRHKSKNRARQKPAPKSLSNSALQQNHQSKQTSKMTSAGLLFRGPAFKGGQTPPDSPTDPIYRTVSAEDLPNRVQDIKRTALPPNRQQHVKVAGKHPAKRHGVMVNGRR